MQLDCPTESDEGKPMTVDALKEEILINSSEDTIALNMPLKQLRGVRGMRKRWEPGV
ncbi:hypothetical protein [Myxosarcina sp. GI1]|uniref:hypothetical protein n=1 Tax=Myxosarcina sp. GI1 TaxID=1541065 RepID=UPI00155AB5CD|nr:hypothetical protein [Myxosarcina sp. GI1]